MPPWAGSPEKDPTGGFTRISPKDPTVPRADNRSARGLGALAVILAGETLDLGESDCASGCATGKPYQLTGVAAVLGCKARTARPGKARPPLTNATRVGARRRLAKSQFTRIPPVA
jgi:hypothetical protein